MKKYCMDLTVASNEHISDHHVLLKLTSKRPLPEMMPGQFVNIHVEDSPTTFLRRPISINFVDVSRNELWLLVAAVGEGTKHMAKLKAGDTLNCLFPLGNGFSDLAAIKSVICGDAAAFSSCEKPDDDQRLRVLLVGGGVGVAPVLYQGAEIKRQGGEPVFLLGARSAKDLLELDLFRNFGKVYVTTEDASAGEKGFVTNHSVLQREHFDFIQTCGPTPMMKAVARFAKEKNIPCEVSLENMMACGLGACLCCVEKTVDGNLCVCKEGPVFNIKKLLW
ncbi:MAG TPA: dihydroorotate dehydrogenase electron transfer subunit [Prevotella sp.]|jgi:dihydroorotate dehydrogenase electron transfer subunit|nr:dihydroorotate dehydrogenase electron transfer subunit [Prevotella sp.]